MFSHDKIDGGTLKKLSKVLPSSSTNLVKDDECGGASIFDIEDSTNPKNAIMRNRIVKNDAILFADAAY